MTSLPSLIAKDWAQNEPLLRQISREARANPDSPYAGQYVGLLNGQVLIVAETAEEALSQMRTLSPDPLEGTVFEANADYESVQEIWGLG